MTDPIMPGYHNRRLGDPFPWGPETGKDVKLGPGATLVGVRLGGGSGVGRLHESGRGEESSQTTASLSAEVELFASRIPLVENELQFHWADGVGLKYSYGLRTDPDE
ncbi:MAG: hypothetical protein HYW02_00615, partial [Deltaproteobacteria bacterium]|nr:hypothetical protein [Deltaproteobacteria bacterium]